MGIILVPLRRVLNCQLTPCIRAVLVGLLWAPPQGAGRGTAATENCCSGGQPHTLEGFQLSWEVLHLPPGSQPNNLGVKAGFPPSEDHFEVWHLGYG